MKTIFTCKKTILKSTFTLVILFLATSTFGQSKFVIEASNTKFSPNELTVSVGDTVVWNNVQGYHNVNGTQTTYPSNPESFGNSPGNGWTLTHVFLTAGKYDYRCDPHFSLGMTGKIEVKDNEMNDDTTKYMLTVNFIAMNPHVGQMLYLSVVDKNSGKEIARTTNDIIVDFPVQVSGIEKNHSYKVNFFADHNGNGMYDAPPADHAWSMDLDNAMGDTTLTFTHNTNFTDIMWKNRLTVHFMGMNPHVGQNLNLKVYDKSSGTVVQEVDTIIAVDFMIYVYGIGNGMSYNVDFYADHNMNGMYDAPPADHAWRLELNNVMGDTTLMFTHNTNFTDIGTTTGINEFSKYSVKMYPNPTKERVTIETSGINPTDLQVFMYDVTGKLKYSATSIRANTINIDLDPYANGIYIVELRTNDYRKMLKLLKN